jgi:hypothetical protein
VIVWMKLRAYLKVLTSSATVFLVVGGRAQSGGRLLLS